MKLAAGKRSRTPWFALASLASAALLAACAGTTMEDGSQDSNATAGDLVDVTLRTTIPAETPQGARVFVAGSFQGWDPSHPDYELLPASDGKYEVTIEVPAGQAIEFKFTRGDWGTVEKSAMGVEIDNRGLTASGDGVHEMRVAGWADTVLPGSTIAGDVVTFRVPGFLDGRRVSVYLPPGYDAATESYPVVYMFDGQNVFNQATSFSGEWEVDESLEWLVADGYVRPLIVVAVDNGGAARIDEYTPWFDPDVFGGVGGEADAHLQAFRDVLVPYIDDNFRTLDGAGDRGIAGSSLGGLMSLYAAYAFGDTFGRIGALSPSLWWDDEHLNQYVAGQPRSAHAVYMDMGTRESGQFVDEDHNGIDDSIDHLRRVRDTLLGQGFQYDVDFTVVEDEGATHAEYYWAQRFPYTLYRLFPAQ